MGTSRESAWETDENVAGEYKARRRLSTDSDSEMWVIDVQMSQTGFVSPSTRDSSLIKFDIFNDK